MVAPRVAVIMAVYNCERYIDECIKSVLSQTFREFEFVIVDDASTDGTLNIIKKYAQQDNRILYAVNEVNSERSFSRNKAVELSNSDIIAVMDADDVAMPDRLEKQVAVMCAHQDVAVVGGAMVGYEDERLFVAHTTRLPAKLLFNSVIYHPTCMFRKEAFQRVGGYDKNQPLAEDYSLWVNFVRNGYSLANIQDVLVRYRVHPDKPRVSYREALRQSMNTVWLRQLSYLGVEAGNLELDIHGSCASLEREIPWRVRQIEKWLAKLQSANRRQLYISSEMLEEECIAIQKALSAPILFTKEPIQYLTKIIFHIFINFCRRTGRLGRFVETLVRMLVGFLKKR